MKQVEGYENYSVSDWGVVVGARGQVLKPDTNRTGYQRVTLCKDGVTKRVFIHRLVAQHYVPNPNNLPILNHKDGNKLNNKASNLEWCSHKHNLAHALSSKLRDLRGRVMMTDEQRSTCDYMLQSGIKYQQIADAIGVSYNTVALRNRVLKERATTIPKGSTSQANGDGSAQPS